MIKKNYSNWNKEELNQELVKRDKLLSKKYGLIWEDKPEAVAELCKKKLPILTEDKSKEIKKNLAESVNILIEGDNYHALSVLNYTHNNKIDIIYIDPPYNRGNKDFIYNDHIVDKNDSYRHSKWLSFISKRLILSKKLLKNQGIIFISIDDTEFAQLKLLVDEIFTNNLLGIFVWQKKYGGGNDSGQIANEHEYILCYSKNKFDEEWLEPHTINYLNRYNEEDVIGRYFWDTLERPGLKSPIEVEVEFEGKIYKLKTFRSQNRVNEDLEKGEIRIVKIGENISFQFKQRLREGKKPRSILRDNQKESDKEANIAFLKIGSNAVAKKELRNIFHKDIFDNPKPTNLIKYLLKISGVRNGIILDFFAGSGTTGHAVLRLNSEEGSSNTFILCTNNENNICRDVCYPRIEKVINGYNDLSDKKVLGYKSNIKYYETDFVDSEPSDLNKKRLVDKSTEMLCLKEDCFDEIKKGDEFKIFTNNQNKYLGIIYDDDGIALFKKEVFKLRQKFVVYVFSLDESAREDEFEDITNYVDLKPIPAAILTVYKRIFK